MPNYIRVYGISYMRMVLTKGCWCCGGDMPVCIEGKKNSRRPRLLLRALGCSSNRRLLRVRKIWTQYFST